MPRLRLSFIFFVIIAVIKAILSNITCPFLGKLTFCSQSFFKRFWFLLIRVLLWWTRKIVILRDFYFFRQGFPNIINFSQKIAYIIICSYISYILIFNLFVEKFLLPNLFFLFIHHSLSFQVLSKDFRFLLQPVWRIENLFLIRNLNFPILLKWFLIVESESIILRIQIWIRVEFDVSLIHLFIIWIFIIFLIERS